MVSSYLLMAFWNCSRNGVGVAEVKVVVSDVGSERAGLLVAVECLQELLLVEEDVAEDEVKRALFFAFLYGQPQHLL